MVFVGNMDCDRNIRINWLIKGAIFCLIFDNIPTPLQFGTLSSGFSHMLSWYFLFILMLVWICQRFKGHFVIEEGDYFIKYIFCLMIFTFLSNILGLFNYPYYNELLSGSENQIEKLPVVLKILNNLGLSIDEKYLTIVWIGVRSVKGSILGTLYTFGFSFILYQFLKKDWDYYFDLITNVVTASVICLCIYSIVELFFLSGFDFAKNILSSINPMIHPIAVDHGWWPPLLWEGQLRSMFQSHPEWGTILLLQCRFCGVSFCCLKKSQ